MTKDDIARVMRHDLDKKLAKLARLNIETPPKGWINVVRKALNMTTDQLAARMGTSHFTSSEYEQSEAKGAMQINTLRRAAAAMNCRLVYAIVPERSLEKTYADRLKFVARSKVELNMKTETTTGAEIDKLAEGLATKLKPGDVWKSIAPAEDLAALAEDDGEEARRPRKCARCKSRPADGGGERDEEARDEDDDDDADMEELNQLIEEISNAKAESLFKKWKMEEEAKAEQAEKKREETGGEEKTGAAAPPQAVDAAPRIRSYDHLIAKEYVPKFYDLGEGRE